MSVSRLDLLYYFALNDGTAQLASPILFLMIPLAFNIPLVDKLPFNTSELAPVIRLGFPPPLV